MAEPPFTIAILLPQTPPAPLFAALPKSDERVHIVLVPIEADIEAVDVSSITALLWVPPTPAARLTALFDRVGAEQLRWIHALSTGVDHLGEFLASRLVPTAVPLTNGRGAFSSSLAEYAMATCLQHNKEFVRCARNRLEKRWDKFTMGTLRGRTMGFVGFGDIAKETAKLAAPFGMRLIALRRHPQKAGALLAKRAGREAHGRATGGSFAARGAAGIRRGAGSRAATHGRGGAVRSREMVVSTRRDPDAQRTHLRFTAPTRRVGW
jgi:lactate dehydrogenase-like 2-hydroxyacid dehydrogenase